MKEVKDGNRESIQQQLSAGPKQNQANQTARINVAPTITKTKTTTTATTITINYKQ